MLQGTSNCSCLEHCFSFGKQEESLAQWACTAVQECVKVQRAINTADHNASSLRQDRHVHKIQVTTCLVSNFPLSVFERSTFLTRMYLDSSNKQHHVCQIWWKTSEQFCNNFLFLISSANNETSDDRNAELVVEHKKCLKPSQQFQSKLVMHSSPKPQQTCAGICRCSFQLSWFHVHAFSEEF